MWLRKISPAPQFPAIRLSTPRLVLRPAEVKDHAQWAAVRGRNQFFLKPYEPTWPEACLGIEFFERRIARLAHEWAADRTYAFLITSKDGELIGGININNVTRGAGQMASLGYWIDEGHQGQGLMAEAARAALEYAFGPLALARMNAATLVGNARSRSMLRRLGFVEEGFAKAYIQIDGRRQDHVLYGLNAADFLSAARHA